jgi:hypothetical protein
MGEERCVATECEEPALRRDGAVRDVQREGDEGVAVKARKLPSSTEGAGLQKLGAGLSKDKELPKGLLLLLPPSPLRFRANFMSAEAGLRLSPVAFSTLDKNDTGTAAFLAAISENVSIREPKPRPAKSSRTGGNFCGLAKHSSFRHPVWSLTDLALRPTFPLSRSNSAET